MTIFILALVMIVLAAGMAFEAGGARSDSRRLGSRRSDRHHRRIPVHRPCWKEGG
jgi:hypothetical protein